jgi:gamma-glutamylcyclotransferase (GGCT)/AIG2-like uncharacterized protein YtfP
MEHLFIYGSLGPGCPNEHVMQTIGGDWIAGSVRGRLIESGWGAAMGFPGIVVNSEMPGTDDIPGHVFASRNLCQHWAYLDEFEGGEYERVNTTVTLHTGELISAFIYALREV